MSRSDTPASRGATSRPENRELTRRALARAEAAGWTRARITALTGASSTNSTKLFDGRAVLDIGLSLALADALGLTLDALFRPLPGGGVAEEGAHFDRRTRRELDEDEILQRLAALPDEAHAAAAADILRRLADAP